LCQIHSQQNCKPFGVIHKILKVVLYFVPHIHISMQINKRSRKTIQYFVLKYELYYMTNQLLEIKRFEQKKIF
ncbi:hypothetical protein MUK42_37560, partial [Musa troglodytarum]